MLKPVIAAALAAGISTTPALADSPFNGTWKGNPAEAKLPGKPDVILLAHSTYQCKTCTPPISVAADGKPHPVSGHDYYDAIAVHITDPHSADFDMTRNGKPAAKMVVTVSADGKTLTRTYTDMTATNGAVIHGTSTESRVAPAPAGAHAISGSWKQNPDVKASDAALTFTVQVEGNTVRITDGMGDDVTGTFGGPYALTKGDPGKTMAKFERLGPRTIRETDMRGGKVVNVSTFTVSADGKTITNVSHDPRDNTTGTYIAHKVG